MKVRIETRLVLFMLLPLWGATCTTLDSSDYRPRGTSWPGLANFYREELLPTYPSAVTEHAVEISVIYIANSHIDSAMGQRWGDIRTERRTPGGIMIGGVLNRNKKIIFFHQDYLAQEKSLAGQIGYVSYIYSHEVGHVLRPQQFYILLPNHRDALHSFEEAFRQSCATRTLGDDGYLRRLWALTEIDSLEFSTYQEECIATRIGTYLQECPNWAVTGVQAEHQNLVRRYLDFLQDAFDLERFDRCVEVSRRTSAYINWHGRQTAIALAHP